jgi:hypothetical protein
MPDSPLSITASVTGILTFIAAILGFVYVRYITLQNAQEEAFRNLASVIFNLRDTSSVIFMREDINIGHESMGAEIVKAIQSANSHLKMLKTSIHGLELRILNVMRRSIGLNTEWLALPTTGDEKARFTHDLSQMAQYMASMTTGRVRGGPDPDPDHRSRFSTAFHVVVYIVTGSRFGMRWYRVRDKVLKMAQDREAFRARLLFHQLQMINM